MDRTPPRLTIEYAPPDCCTRSALPQSPALPSALGFPDRPDTMAAIPGGSVVKEKTCMSPFRCLDGTAAGANALGILVPPSRRTLVIVRPRALDYDLLPVRSPGGNGARSAFEEMDHAAASQTSQELFRALEAWAAGGSGQVEPVPTSGG